MNTLPKFNASDTDQKTTRYRLIKYAIGKNCTKIGQAVHYQPISSNDGETSSWACERLDVSDGSASGGLMPSNFGTIEVVTISSKPLAVDHERTPMVGFLVEASSYTCEVGYWEIIGKTTLHC